MKHDDVDYISTIYDIDAIRQREEERMELVYKIALVASILTSITLFILMVTM